MMKLKRKILFSLLTLITLGAIGTYGNVQAATVTTKELNLKAIRSSGYGYKVVNNQTKTIWKIYNADNETFYCIKGGPGFGSTSNGDMEPSINATSYTQHFDLKDPDSIGSNYTSKLIDKNSTDYQRFMWVLDQCYVPAKKNASTTEINKANENRKILLDAVEKYAENSGANYHKDKCDILEDFDNGYDLMGDNWQAHKLTDHLTDDDIEAVQQLAIWYYTNSDAYHVENQPTIWINTVKNAENSTYVALGSNGDISGSRNIDTSRLYAMNALFDYLTKTPKQSGFSYRYQKTSTPVEIANTDVNFTESGNRLIVGPYRVDELRSDINYDLDVTFYNSSNREITDIKFLDSNKRNEIPEAPTDENFYISIPKNTDKSLITFRIDGYYYTTETTYWSVENPAAKDQPVVQIEKVRHTISDEKEDGTTPTPEIEVDLALRKFITSIVPTPTIKPITPPIDLDMASTSISDYDYTKRVPKIENDQYEKLVNGTIRTATKTHDKNALTVQTGDIVTYKIRVYNEGTSAAYATEVTDYLPAGLEFLKDSQINQNNGWSNPSNDGKTIVTSKLSNQKLSPVTTTSMDYRDLEVECKVIATVGEAAKSLKNIAAITGYADKDGNVITTDRDSQPDKFTQTQLDNYGKTSKQDDDDFEELRLEGNVQKEIIDLALRKFITSIRNSAITVDYEDDRTPKIDKEQYKKLTNETIETAEKVHPKDALTVQTGSIVTYKIRVYNEGNTKAYATKVTDYLPTGLKFLPDSELNKKYGWSNPSGDRKTIETSYLSDKVIEPITENDIDYKDLEIECEVTASAGVSEKELKNIAAITGYADKNGNAINTDRDSQPNKFTQTELDNYGTTSKQDDDDFERLKLLPKEGAEFDLSLRKYITAVNDVELSGDRSRKPVPDTTPLRNGETTAHYNHRKDPISVDIGTIVTYTITVYNEGDIDGYVTEITDHLPPQLEYINDTINAKYGWKVSADGRTVTTDITSPKTENSANRDEIYKDRKNGTLLKAYTGADTLDSIDVQIRCKVKENIEIKLDEKITNIAEISKFTDEDGNTIVDRDSEAAKNFTLPEDSKLPDYTGGKNQKNDPYYDGSNVIKSDGKEYYPGQEDDDDFEKLVLQRFDLALRKFITAVGTDVNADVKDYKQVTDRVPVPVKEGSSFKYEHTKEPLLVAYQNVVIYTLRVYNEGNIDGYAKEVKDNLPEGLEYLPEHSVNTTFGWKMYGEDGKETKNVEEAKYIKTNFLSKENEKAEGDNLIKNFDPDTMTMPNYKELKIAFKVVLPNTATDKIIINKAEITNDSDKQGNPIDDSDSTDNWVEGEDDQDIEKIKVKYFDLSLKKWVTESIVTYNGKTTTTKTGHTGNENPEPPAKVDLKTKQISKTTVKFKYNISVTNEGDIAGYASELIDYIPAGLKFDAKDNPKWKEVDGKVVTDQLKDTLLKPGETAKVEIILTWINNKDNLGEKVNWAEISKDRNEENSPDIDSTPGNNVKGEDDIDQAPVVLSIVTGSEQTYMLLTLASITIMAGGVLLIKKFVIM